MSTTSLPMFKEQVPEWLIRVTIFMLLLPALSIFALYFSNATETAGYYGVEPADVQYSVIVMYATLVTFLPMDDRLVKYLKPRQYFVLGVVLNTLTYFICATTRSFVVFMICRFLQGIVCAMFCSICLHLIFPRLHSARARAIGYSVFYGTLQISIPFCALLCSWMLYYFEFNTLFCMLILIETPGILLFLLITNKNVRFRKKFPLYQLDWVSYVFYTFACCATGYIFVYGQKLNWLDSPLIRTLIAATLIASLLFGIRQFHLKRPFINLRVFRYTNFRNGLLLLMLYYIFKGTTGFAYAYLQGVLGVDPVHLTLVWLVNITGIIAGIIVSAVFILRSMSVKKILIAGFSYLLFFHIQMYFLFSTVAATEDLLLPMFLQGLGTGSLFVPIVIFTVTAVPASISGHVSFLGIAFRFIGFCSSIAIANYFQLYNRSTHYNRFRQHMTELNPAVNETMKALQQQTIWNGQDDKTAHAVSSGLLNKAVSEQVGLLSSMDYYTMMIGGLLILLVLLLLLSPVKKMLFRVSKKFLPY